MLEVHSSPDSFPRSRRRFLLLALVTSLVGSSRAQQPVSTERLVRDLLQTHHKWVFAYTVRLPLDPLEIWDQNPATISRDGDGLSLKILSSHTGYISTHPLMIRPDGFAFELTGYGQVFMRLDSVDSKAPFKGQVGDKTYWLLRAQ